MFLGMVLAITAFCHFHGDITTFNTRNYAISKSSIVTYYRILINMG